MAESTLRLSLYERGHVGLLNRLLEFENLDVNNRGTGSEYAITAASSAGHRDRRDLVGRARS